MSYFPEPYSCNENKITVELDWSNYATKSDLKAQKVWIHQTLLKRLI